MYLRGGPAALGWSEILMRLPLRWPGRLPWRRLTRLPLHRPATRRGWLITVALAVAALAVKLVLGLGVALLLLHRLPR
jgi:hypothetical protein